MADAAYTNRSSSSWAWPEGNEIPLVLPLELTSEAMIRPRSDKLAAKAVSERRNTRTAPPSARTNPSAPSENARQRPVGDTMDACEKEINDVGAEMILMPATIAVSTRPERNASHAAFKATSEEEHAVSNVTLGPRRSKIYKIRLAITAKEFPVAKCESPAAGSPMNPWAYSVSEAPT